MEALELRPAELFVGSTSWKAEEYCTVAAGVCHNAMDHDAPLGAVGRCIRACVLQMPMDC
jgi:hypothetical protein